MNALLVVLCILCLVVGVAGCLVPMLPGPPVSFAALLLARWAGAGISDGTLLLMGAVTVAVTVADYFLPVWFTARFGGSPLATRLSMVGIIAGLFFMPFGIVIGPFLGALAGEFLNGTRELGRLMKVSFGSFAAFFFGTGIKLIASAAMSWQAVHALVS